MKLSCIYVGLVCVYVSVCPRCPRAQVTVAAPCRRRCDEKLATETRAEDESCGQECRVEQCKGACDRWENTSFESCIGSCDIKRLTNNNEVQYCKMGCKLADGIFIEKIKEQFKNLTAPKPLTADITSTSVKFEWRALKVPKKVRVIIQIKEVQESADWNDATSHFLSDDYFIVRGLQSYTSYKARVVLKGSKVISTSPESKVFRTKEASVPPGPPTLVGVDSTSSTVFLEWQPPRYSNAKLEHYHIILRSENISRRDYEVAPNVNSYTFRGLEASSTYQVELKAHNRYGGSRVLTQEINTTEAVLVNGRERRDLCSDTYYIPAAWEKEKVYVVYGTKRDVTMFEKPQKHEIAAPRIIFTNEDDITAVAVHYHRQFVFVADLAKNLIRFSWSPDRNFSELKNLRRLSSVITSLSVDWLYDDIYYSTSDSISLCNIDGEDCRIVREGVPEPAKSILVDAYNGHLFWSGPNEGIYQLFLASYDKNEARLEARHEVIESNITAFMVNYRENLLYFPQGTFLMEYSLNDMSLKEAGEMIKVVDISAMAWVGKVFYIHSGSGDFTYMVCARSRQKYKRERLTFGLYSEIHDLNVWHPAAQPVPVPLNVPKKVGALCMETSLQISWQYTSYRGREGWPGLRYEVELSGDMTRNVTTQQISVMLESLLPGKLYHVRVRAVSLEGPGTWSETKSCTTFVTEPHLVLTDGYKVFESKLNGADQSELTSVTCQDCYIREVITGGTDLIWTTENGRLYYLSDKGSKQIMNVENAQVAAFDWLGKKVYWWSESEAGIYRCDLACERPEYVYRGVDVQSLAVDSLRGLLYWASRDTVCQSSLSGQKYRVIHRKSPVPNNHVVAGLTLDLATGTLYWSIQQTSSIYTLYKAMPQNGFNKELLASADTSSSSHFLQLVENHFFILGPKKQPAVLSYDGKVEAHVTTIKHSVKSMALRHPSLSPYPDGLDSSSTRVIPKMVHGSTIHISSNDNKILVSWAHSYISYGDLFYNVHIKTEAGLLIPRNGLQQNFTDVTNLLKPYSTVKVSVRAYSLWGSAPVAEATLKTPMSVPSAPNNLKAYTYYNRTEMFAKPNVTIYVFWSKPHSSNGALKKYNLYYKEVQSESWSTESVKATLEKARVRAEMNQTYQIKLEACTEVGCGKQTPVVNINTSVEDEPPKLLAISEKTVKMIYIAENSSHTLNSQTASLGFTSYTFLSREHMYYMATGQGHIRSWDGSKVEQLLHREYPVTVTDMTVDWLERSLYWIEKPDNGGNHIYKYNLNTRLSTLVHSTNYNLHHLAIDPYNREILWIGEKSRTFSLYLAHLDVKMGQPKVILPRGQDARRRRRRDLADSCSCYQNKIGGIFTFDHSNTDDRSLYFVNSTDNSIWKMSLTGCSCKQIITGSIIEGDLKSMTVDTRLLYWLTSSGQVNCADKNSGKDVRVVSTPGSSKIMQIVSYGPQCQPLPDKKCLVPGRYDKTVDVQRSARSMQLQILPWQQPASCSRSSYPTVFYIALYRKARSDTDVVQCSLTNTDCLQKDTTKNTLTLDNLDPWSWYQVQIVAKNHFSSDPEDMTPGPVQFFQTDVAAPEMVGQITTTMKNPEEILLRWEAPTFTNGPLSSLRYVVQWRNQEMNESTEKEQDGLVQESVKLKKADGIRGGKTFIYKVFAYQENRNKSGPTKSITLTQYQYPGEIVRLPSDDGSLSVQWISPSDDIIYKHIIACREVGSPLPYKHSPERATKKSTTYNETFSGLKAETKYAFRIEAFYVNGDGRFLWPLSDKEPVFGTGENRPGKPDPPKVVEFDKYKNVTWKLSDNGGLPIITYELYVRNYSDDKEYLVYNNTRTSWTVQNLIQGKSYTFKVRALNKLGFGEFSLESTPFDPPVTASSTQPPENRQWIIILAAFFGVVILVIAAIIACFMMRKVQPRVPSSSRTVNSELATLRELPNGTVHTTNTLYAINIVLSEEDIAGLPHFPREHLRLTKFLGSGAFGEVFEGVALDILGSNTGETNVAVKTLQKGATDQEKEEFLKEALLMGNFKHNHILGILGVCIRDDPQFIIMELMECGDLLSYLRQSRSTPMTDGNLAIGEMVTVCAQVADGCKYMESMHFVHRDLAARNCLVCYRNGERIVKIGDFGLARDIYRSDYYRKEGQGLLPVRWMSPESLIDGVFTTQSDVWAYGVLVWEVLTLGQQPYPARTNIEVLHYVRAQGTLDRPRNCPDDLYSLMLRCWEYEPDRRPSFCKIHQDLLELEGRDLEAEMMAAAQAPVDYARIASGGIVNEGFDVGPNEFNLKPNQSQILRPPPVSGTEEEEPLTRSPPVQPPDQQPEQDSRASTNVRKENGGYMQPVGQPKTPLPEYLELIPDDVPIQDTTDMDIHGKNEPKYSPRQMSKCPGHRLNYAHLAASSDYESDDSGTDDVNADRSKDGCDRFTSQYPVLNYADLSSSGTRGQGVPSSNPLLNSNTRAGVEMDTDNPYLRNVLAPNKTKSLPTTQPSSGSCLNYASLPSTYPDSSIDTDNPYAVSAFDKNRACNTNNQPQNNHRKNNLKNDNIINYAVLPGNSFSDGDIDTDNPYVAGLDTPGPVDQQNHNSRLTNHKVPLQKPQRVALPQNSVNYASLNGGNPDRNVISALVTLDRQRESNV